MSAVNCSSFKLFSTMALLALGSMPGLVDGANVINLMGNATFPEGILGLSKDTALVGGFDDGSLQRVNLTSGEASYFSAPAENGMVIAVGFDINEATGELWVANFNFDLGNGFPGSQLKVFDVETAELVATIPPDFVPGVFLNEVTVDQSTGKVYVSDTLSPIVWTAGPDTTTSLDDASSLRVFVNNTLLKNQFGQPFGLNGLTITPDKQYLIASVMDRLDAGDGALLRIDLATQQVVQVELTNDDGAQKGTQDAVAAFAGSDGMFFEQDSGLLFMVNVFSSAGAIITAAFNDDYTVASLATRDQTSYNRPTASAAIDGKLWTVNSQLDHIIDDANGALNTPPDLPFQIVGVPLADLLPGEPSAAFHITLTLTTTAAALAMLWVVSEN